MFNLTELCANNSSSFKNSRICTNIDHIDLSNRHLVALSDLARFFILDIYGGIYTDGDVIYLKDTII